MTQVELNDGSRWMVAFVPTKLAVKGAQLEVGDVTWTVTVVYQTEDEAYVAWSLRARHVT